MIYGNLISYSSTKKGKVWLFDRASPWVQGSAYPSPNDFPIFYIEGNYSTIYSNLSTTGNQYQPLVMSPGDLIYAEFTYTGGGAYLTRSQIIAAGGRSYIGGAWGYSSAMRCWWRYYGSTVFSWSTRFVANGRSHHGFIEYYPSSNQNKFYVYTQRFNAGIASVGFESVTYPKTLYGGAGYGNYYGAATTNDPNYGVSCNLRKFVWQPSDAIVPSSAIQYTGNGWDLYPTATRPILYREIICGAGRGQYDQPSITLEEYEATHWNDTIVTGP